MSLACPALFALVLSSQPVDDSAPQPPAPPEEVTAQPTPAPPEQPAAPPPAVAAPSEETSAEQQRKKQKKKEKRKQKKEQEAEDAANGSLTIAPGPTPLSSAGSWRLDLMGDAFGQTTVNNETEGASTNGSFGGGVRIVSDRVRALAFVNGGTLDNLDNRDEFAQALLMPQLARVSLQSEVAAFKVFDTDHGAYKDEDRPSGRHEVGGAFEFSGGGSEWNLVDEADPTLVDSSRVTSLRLAVGPWYAWAVRAKQAGDIVISPGVRYALRTVSALGNRDFLQRALGSRDLVYQSVDLSLSFSFNGVDLSGTVMLMLDEDSSALQFAEIRPALSFRAPLISLRGRNESRSKSTP
ncbi:MAG: hypothetical protein ACE37F_09745 [Nannocystaceae bacterium]|nr:hypothetical protein [bacterium]